MMLSLSSVDSCCTRNFMVFLTAFNFPPAMLPDLINSDECAQDGEVYFAQCTNASDGSLTCQELLQGLWESDHYRY